MTDRVDEKGILQAHEDVLSLQEDLDTSVIDLPKTQAQALTTIPFKKSLQLFFTMKAPPRPPKRKFFFWIPPDQSKFETKLVFKLDCAIMTYVCLSYFTRYLDATNVSSAYVTGMKEDLKLTGEQYVWLTQLFSSAYSVAGFASTLLLTKVRFSRLLPLLEISWALFCLFIYKAQSFKTIAALRFCQGLCEGTAWPAIHYMLGSWYTGKELGKRTSIFTAAGIAGVLLSGLIQSGLQKTMNGRNGLEGWRWLFIIDACITFPIAFLGLMVPDAPENTRARFYLSQEELDFARERVKVDGKERINRLDLSTFKRVFSSYQWYLFGLTWIMWSFAGTLQGYMSVVLKALGYDVYDRNNIPSGISGVGILACLTSGFIVDILGRRIEVALFLQLLWVIGAIITRVFYVSKSALIFGYCIQGVYYAISPVIVGWCNELCKEDNQLRAATIGSLNLLGGLLSIPYTTQLFNTDYAPRYDKASIGTLTVCILMFFHFFVILAFDRYQNRKRAYIREIYAAQGDVDVLINSTDYEINEVDVDDVSDSFRRSEKA